MRTDSTTAQAPEPQALVSASAFGFGPAGKLAAICSELRHRSCDCHFVGRGTALTFAQMNSGSYASIAPVDTTQDLLAVDTSQIDVVISVMDSSLPVLARARGLPCVYVDSLFWMWDWPESDRQELDRVIQKLRRKASAGEALEMMATLPLHAAQYVAHHLATISCVQDAPGVSARISEFGEAHRYITVAGIVDLTYREDVGRDLWLATASGLLNPFRTFELAVEWLTIVISMIKEAVVVASIGEPVIVAGNPSVLSEITRPVSPPLEFIALDHKSMLRAMNRAIGCLTPPGLTTILECSAYGVPVVMLPEQHYAHAANFRRFAGSNPGVFRHALIDQGLDRRAGMHLEETLAIARDLRDHAEARSTSWKRMVEAVAEGMSEIRRKRSEVFDRQRAAVVDVVGGYEGASEVVSCVREAVQMGVD